MYLGFIIKVKFITFSLKKSFHITYVTCVMCSMSNFPIIYALSALFFLKKIVVLGTTKCTDYFTGLQAKVG